MKALYILVLIFTTSIMSTSSQSLYDFKLPAIDGKHTIDFADFRGKKVLVVNTASECGYTPQYKDLQQLHLMDSDKLVIVGIPSNDFGKQEPGSNEEIVSFCSKNYGVTFLLAQKLEVTGENMHPFIKYILAQNTAVADDYIKWNFEKFIFDENGNFVAHFRSRTNPLDDDIINLVK